MKQRTIVFCAWCQQYGRPHTMARASHSAQWHRVSHAAAEASRHDSTASHGICPACHQLVAREWGIDLPRQHAA